MKNRKSVERECKMFHLASNERRIFFILTPEGCYLLQSPTKYQTKRHTKEQTTPVALLAKARHTYQDTTTPKKINDRFGLHEMLNIKHCVM